MAFFGADRREGDQPGMNPKRYATREARRSFMAIEHVICELVEIELFDRQ